MASSAPMLASLFLDFSPPNGSSFPTAQPLPFPHLSTSSSRAAVLICHSKSSKAISATSDTPQPQQTKPTPSLADQLRPLSLTILKDRPQTSSDDPIEPQPHVPGRSTWVNPSRPRRKVLSLQRQRRTSPSSAPQHNVLSSVYKNISSLRLSEDVDDPSDFASFSSSVDEAFLEPPTRDTAIYLLNGLRPWHMVYRFFRWLKAGDFFPMETLMYNVVMKSLKHGRRHDLVERLAQEMIESGVELDNITYCTVITAAKRRRQFAAAIGWFERMYETGLMPDEFTYSAALDVYARLGRVGEALSLVDRGRAIGWTPDPLAFTVVVRVLGEMGDYAGIKSVLAEMENLGVQPNVVLYNTAIEAAGKTGNPGFARKLFDVMVAAGVDPNEKTLTVLLKAYRIGGRSKDALYLWEQMKSNEWPVDTIACNAMLSACAEFGFESQAEQLFAEMKASENCRPDTWSYNAMVTIYCKSRNIDKMMRVYDEMLKGGYVPDVMTCTSLMNCFVKAGRVDDVLRVFDDVMEHRIRPDDALRCCLLSVVATCKEGEMGKVLACLEKADPSYVKFIQLLSSEHAHMDVVKEEFKAILSKADPKYRKGICNQLIDVCWNQNFPRRRAEELFSLGIVYGLFPNLQSEISNEWSLDLRSLSLGAAYTAFEYWVSNLAGKIKAEGALPQLFSVHTGTGNLASALASHIEKSAAPFQRQGEERYGQFMATKEELISWMQARASLATSGT